MGQPSGAGFWIRSFTSGEVHKKLIQAVFGRKSVSLWGHRPASFVWQATRRKTAPEMLGLAAMRSWALCWS